MPAFPAQKPPVVYHIFRYFSTPHPAQSKARFVMLNIFSVSNIDAVKFLDSVSTDRRENYIVTDPPYGNIDSYHYEGSLKDPVLSDEYIKTFTDSCFKKAQGAFIFCDLNHVEKWSKALKTSGYKYARTGVWIKPNAYWVPTPYTGGALEGFVYACKSRADGAYSRIPAYICSFSGHLKEGEKGHPFRKPVPLVRQILRDLGLEDKNILDPFAGGGSIGVAALLEGNNSFSNDLDLHVIDNLEWRMSNFKLWETSQPKRGIIVAQPKRPRKTHKPRAAAPVAATEETKKKPKGSGKPRTTPPLTAGQKKAIVVAMLHHTKRKTEGKPMTEREFLTILLGPHYNVRLKKGQERIRGTLGRPYPQDKLWSECRKIVKMGKKNEIGFKGEKGFITIDYPRDTAEMKAEREFLELLDDIDYSQFK